MAAPDIYFFYNTTTNDVPYTGAGAPDANYSIVNANSDKIVFTGGGIEDAVLTKPTCASGTRSPTIRPGVSSYVIPDTYIETDTLMYNVPLAGLMKSGVPNPNRYVFGVYVDGRAESSLYLEAWDDSTFSTTNLAVLQGSVLSGDQSYVNAIRTTDQVPPWSWPPGWNGASNGAAYIRGSDRAAPHDDHRVKLKLTLPIENENLYWNIYVRLQTDSVTFHNMPVLTIRYLYV